MEIFTKIYIKIFVKISIKIFIRIFINAQGRLFVTKWRLLTNIDQSFSSVIFHLNSLYDFLCTIFIFSEEKKTVSANFGGLDNIPGLSSFWRPPVVVEQNYPPPSSHDSRPLPWGLPPSRVAMFKKSLRYFEIFKFWISFWLPRSSICQSKLRTSQSLFKSKNVERFSLLFLLLKTNIKESLRKV